MCPDLDDDHLDHDGHDVDHDDDDDDNDDDQPLYTGYARVQGAREVGKMGKVSIFCVHLV